MRDVVPLESDPRGRVRAAPRRTAPSPTAPAPATDRDEPHDFAAHGVDRREIRKLKQGAYDVSGRHDVHGMTAAEALASVQRFIDNSRHRGHRCVCIVHGRGLHSRDNAPVLKTRIRAWLRSHRAVLGYSDAPVADGGSGAVYVLLRK